MCCTLYSKHCHIYYEYFLCVVRFSYFRRVNQVMLVPTWGAMVATVVTSMLVLLAAKRWYDSQQLCWINVTIIHVKMVNLPETTDESRQHYSPPPPYPIIGFIILGVVRHNKFVCL